MKVSGKAMREMEKGNIHGQMEANIKEVSNRVIFMDLECIRIKKGVNTQDSGKMIRDKDLGNISMQMEISMMDNGRITFDKEEEKKYIQMDHIMMENGRMI